MIIPLLFFLVTSFQSSQQPVAPVPSAEFSRAPETMRAYVAHYFADTPVLADIAWCESRDRQWGENGELFRGSVNRYDVGIMQVNVLYHEEKAKALGLDLYGLSGNLAYAKVLYAAEGTKPWTSSEACWGTLADN